MKFKIKTKLIFGALTMAVVLMASSAAIVAFIVGKQTRAGIDEGLVRTANIIKDELSTQKQVIMDQCKRLVSSSEMANQIKFIHEYPGKNSLSTTRSSYVGNTGTLFQSETANRFSSMATYDKDGNLATFVYINNDGNYSAGFNVIDKDGTFILEAQLSGNDKLSDDRFVEKKEVPNLPLKIDIASMDISSESSAFVSENGTLSIKVTVPLMGNAYNPETEKVEPTPMGVLVVFNHITGAFCSEIKKMTGLDINIYVGGRYVDGTLKGYSAYDAKDSFKRGDTLASQEAYMERFTLDGMDYFDALLPVYNGENLAGTIASIQSGAIVSANIKNILMQLSVVNVICILLILPVIYFLSLRLSKPLEQIVTRFKDIAEGEGDLTMRLDNRSNDEIGELAHWFNIFLDKLHGIITLIASDSKHINSSSQNMTSLSHQMSENSCDMVGHLNRTTSSVESVNESFISVAAAMEQSSTNLSMIVAASEELAVTIGEVSRKSEDASKVSNDAVKKAGEISGRIKELGEAAQKIGKVTDLINEISEQTNLLSLNATIEAARAGESGKGFTVVAGEIKELAKQTAEATSSIKSQIDGIQNSTEVTARDVEEILSVINSVNETIISIVSDIGEQSSATQEINSNVAHASQGISDVNRNIAHNSTMVTEINSNISDVDTLANNIANRSSDVAKSAGDLLKLSEKLDELVRRFKI